jgi:hypothetical protein
LHLNALAASIQGVIANGFGAAPPSNSPKPDPRRQVLE